MARPDKPLEAQKTGRSRFAEVWRDLRLGQRLNQGQVAAALDCTSSYISNIEHARRLPRFDRLARYEKLVKSNGLLRSYWEWAMMERAAMQAGEPAVPEGRWVPGDHSKFVEDVVPRDGTVFGPGERFKKIWRIRNAGRIEWRGRVLIQAGPSAPRYAPWSLDDNIPVPTTRAGEVAQIETTMRAPGLPGAAIAHFYMVHSDGLLCFPDRYADGIYLRIEVREPISLNRLG